MITNKMAVKNINQSKYLSSFFSVLIILFGFAALVGLHFHIVVLTRFFPTSDPIIYNAGLCFFLSGISLLAVIWQYKRVAIPITTIIFLLAFLGLCEYVLDVDLGIDQLFMLAGNVLGATHPGAMPLNTTIGFLITSIILFTLESSATRTRTQLVVLILLNTVIFILGLVSLLGYVANVPTADGWGELAPTVPNTAVGLTAISITIASVIYYEGQMANIDVSKFTPLILGSTISVGVFLLWQTLLATEQSNIRRMVALSSDNIVNQVIMQIDTTVVSLVQTARYFEAQKQPREKIASIVQLNQQAKYEAMGWIDHHFDLKWIAPLQQQKQFVNYFSSRDKYLESVLNNARLTQNVILFYPGASLKDKNNFFIFVPTYIEKTNMGFIFAIVDAQKLFDGILNEKMAKDFSILIYKGNHVLYELKRSNQQSVPKYTVVTNKIIYGDDWQIKVWPNLSLIKRFSSPFPMIIFTLGLLSAALLSLTVYFLQLTKSRAKELETSQTNLSFAQKTAHLGSWVWTLSSDRVWCSDETLSILEWTSEKQVLIAKDFFSFVHPDEHQNLQELMKEIRGGKQLVSGMFTLLCSDNRKRQIYLEAKISKKHGKSPAEITGILQDITSQRYLEQQLLQAQKMEMVGQLTGGLAHEFNNLLMVVQGNLELLAARFTESTLESRRLRAAISATERGVELTSRLLAFSRRQPLQPKGVDVREIITNFLKLLKPTLSEAIEISVSNPLEVWPVWVDPGQLENALLNLTVNARDAMSDRGKLSFEIKNVSLDEESAEKFQIAPGDYVKIAMSDTGIGIEPEILDHVFEPFFTTKETGRASGLGLSMVYGFVKQSRGHITINSVPNQGTTVTLYLPKAVILNEASGFAMGPPEGNETILVVEDEILLRKLTVEYLQNLGYRVYEASNGSEALKILKKTPQITLLFTDVIMPGDLTGSDLALQAREINPNMKVLFTSGYPKTALFEKKEFAVSVQLLSKPYKMRDLGAKIRDVLDKNS